MISVSIGKGDNWVLEFLCSMFVQASS